MDQLDDAEDGATAAHFSGLRSDSAPPAPAHRRLLSSPPFVSKPESLGEALRAAGTSLETSGGGSDTPSEEDYDENIRPAYQPAGLRQRRSSQAIPSSLRQGVIRRDSGVYIIPDEGSDIQSFLQKSSQRASTSLAPDLQPSSQFRHKVFTHQFSTFDRQNKNTVNSPFHGFYNLFWLGVALFVGKIWVENWRDFGSPLGGNEIMKTMFRRDVLVLLTSDAVMCGLTGVTSLIQSVVFRGHLEWNRGGWILQHTWQSLFFAAFVGWTLIRDWPWTHTVFFVLHGLVMLMKQHSYAFYNGHLSTVYARRQYISSKLELLEEVDDSKGASFTETPVSEMRTSHLDKKPMAEHRDHPPCSSTNTEKSDIEKIAKAIASREPLDQEQIHLFERILKWEIEACDNELKGTTLDQLKAYPSNLGLWKFYEWIPLPTVVYEIEYPRSDHISWSYVAEKLVAMVGVIFVMIQISQHYIYPVVVRTVEMKEHDVTLVERLQEFPWMLSDLMFPFLMEFLLSWYLIWETILNVLAELTFFADRSFYDAWWNSVSWDQYARDWNRPVHIFLLRHVYHSSISSMKVNKHTATLITFFFSACVHELLMLCLFKKLRGYLLLAQMSQLPMVRLSRTKWLKGHETVGNLIFWLGLCTGPSLLCSLYLIL